MDADLPQDKVKQFLKDYESDFKDLSLQHIKKIEYWHLIGFLFYF